MESGGRLSREVEFEFSEDGGTTVPTGQVRGVILRHLHHGEIDSAAKLLQQSPPELGDQILEEDAKNASIAVKGAVAEMFVRAKDMERAARAAVLMGDPARAAPFFEQAGQLSRAAELYERGGRLEQAAELYARDLKFEQAARLFDASGKADRAAEILERGGRLLEAGQLWMKVRRLDKAIEALGKIDARHETFVRGAVLYGRILEGAGHRDAAAQKYLEVVKSRPIDAHSVEAFERLAEIYVAMKQPHFAQKLLTAVVQFDGTRAAAVKALQALGGAPPGAGTPQQGAPPGGAPSGGFVALASGTFGTPAAAPRAPAPSSPDHGMRAPAPSSPDHGMRAPAQSTPDHGMRAPAQSSPDFGAPALLVLPPMPGAAPGQGGPQRPAAQAAQGMPAGPAGQLRAHPQAAPLAPPSAPHMQVPPAAAPPHTPAVAVQPHPAAPAAPPQATSAAHVPVPPPVQAAPAPAPLSPDALALRDLPAFAELTPDELRGLAEAGERCVFQPGEIVIEQEQEARFVLVVLSGVARVARMAPDGMFPLAEVGVGSLLGELALVDEGPTSARVKAHTELACMRWPIHRLRAFLGTQERAMLKILKVVTRTLSVRLRETNRRLTS